MTPHFALESFNVLKEGLSLFDLLLLRVLRAENIQIFVDEFKILKCSRDQTNYQRFVFGNTVFYLLVQILNLRVINFMDAFSRPFFVEFGPNAGDIFFKSFYLDLKGFLISETTVPPLVHLRLVIVNIH